jgi:hypothetical protein
MKDTEKIAPCPLHFAASGGRFDSRGMPVFGGSDYEDSPALLCDTAFDCASCPLLQEWLQARANEGWAVGWECIDCVSDSWRVERDLPDAERMLPGFYQAGRDPALVDGDEDYDPDHPTLSGCTSCGRGTTFLQAVLRRARVR